MVLRQFMLFQLFICLFPIAKTISSQFKAIFQCGTFKNYWKQNNNNITYQLIVRYITTNTNLFRIFLNLMKKLSLHFWMLSSSQCFHFSTTLLLLNNSLCCSSPWFNGQCENFIDQHHLRKWAQHQHPPLWAEWVFCFLWWIIVFSHCRRSRWCRLRIELTTWHLM